LTEVPTGVHLFDIDGRFKIYVAVPEDNFTNLVEHPLEPTGVITQPLAVWGKSLLQQGYGPPRSGALEPR
jgi:hypothetical protein